MEGREREVPFSWLLLPNPDISQHRCRPVWLSLLRATPDDYSDIWPGLASSTLNRLLAQKQQARRSYCLRIKQDVFAGGQAHRTWVSSGKLLWWVIYKFSQELTWTNWQPPFFAPNLAIGLNHLACLLYKCEWCSHTALRLAIRGILLSNCMFHKSAFQEKCTWN